MDYCGVPTRYVIGQDGITLYADVNPDYTRRPEPEDMLPALRQAAVKSAALEPWASAPIRKSA